jgi:glycosyltransferase involved in cell wall biosynthesis
VSDSRPTVLVLGSTFPRWDGDTEPRFVESLSYELAEFFDVIVLAPHCEGAARQEVFSNGEHSIEVRRFRYFFAKFESLAYDGGILSRVRQNPLRLLLLPLFLLGQAIATVRLCRSRKVDAIHAHWIVPQGFTVAVLRLLSNRLPPFLVTSHGGDLYALRGRLLERLKRWVLGKADAVTVVSEAMRDYCNEKRIAPAQIHVQSMGVDLVSKFTPGDGKAPRDGLVFVGRLVEKKGVAYLIEAVSILADRYPELRLNIVGDGPLRQWLEDLVVRLGLQDSVKFLGSVPNEAVPDYLRAAKIFAMPSVVAESGDQEGLGLVAVEALGCGCAVVAFDLPAVRDTIINGETGLMARPEDTTDLADKISLLLDDDARRIYLAEAGRRYAIGKFNWTAVGESYANIIGGLITSAESN